jgi:hypothetical protein
MTMGSESFSEQPSGRCGIAFKKERLYSNREAGLELIQSNRENGWEHHGRELATARDDR